MSDISLVASAYFNITAVVYVPFLSVNNATPLGQGQVHIYYLHAN